MKSSKAAILVTGFVVCAGLAVALIGRPVAAADDAVRTADKALTAAFEKGDKASLNKYLDADFTWIDQDGVMVAREDALALGATPLVGEGDGVEIIERPYGDQVVWLQTRSGKNYAARFWVKRAAGWWLLHTSEIAVRPGEENVVVRPTYDVPCMNPCKRLSIRTVDKTQAAAMAGWQEQESGRQYWLKHVADHNVTVSTYGGAMLPKKDRPNPPPPKPGEPTIGAAPVLWARLWTFGPETVVMIACQSEYGSKAYWASRVFHYQHGIWQMAESYHTTIQASGVMTEVQGK